MSSVFVFNQLTKRYGNRLGLDGLDLRGEPGELLGFLGPNGAGKSTAIRCLMGLLRPTSGEAALFGRDAWSQGHVARADVGYLPGDFRFYPWMTLRSGARMWEAARGRPVLRNAESLAERFELEPDLRVSKMSRGTRQKLGLILALSHDPKLLVLDEPTTALDPVHQQSLFEVLRERASAGATVFFSSHTLSEVEALCDRVAILRGGRLVVLETMKELRARAQRRVVIRWKDDASPDSITPPSDLSLSRSSRGTWEGALTGSAMNLTRWCTNQPIADLTIEEPDLDTVFLGFYADEAGS